MNSQVRGIRLYWKDIIDDEKLVVCYRAQNKENISLTIIDCSENTELQTIQTDLNINSQPGLRKYDKKENALYLPGYHGLYKINLGTGKEQKIQENDASTGYCYVSATSDKHLCFTKTGINQTKDGTLIINTESDELVESIYTSTNTVLDMDTVYYTLSDEEGKESIHKKKIGKEDSDTEFCDIDEEYSLMGQTGRWLVLNTYTNKIESEFTPHFKFVDKNDSGNERDPRNFTKKRLSESRLSNLNDGVSSRTTHVSPEERTALETDFKKYPPVEDYPYFSGLKIDGKNAYVNIDKLNGSIEIMDYFSKETVFKSPPLLENTHPVVTSNKFFRLRKATDYTSDTALLKTYSVKSFHKVPLEFSVQTSSQAEELVNEYYITSTDWLANNIEDITESEYEDKYTDFMTKIASPYLNNEYQNVLVRGYSHGGTDILRLLCPSKSQYCFDGYICAAPSLTYECTKCEASKVEKHIKNMDHLKQQPVAFILGKYDSTHKKGAQDIESTLEELESVGIPIYRENTGHCPTHKTRKLHHRAIERILGTPHLPN